MPTSPKDEIIQFRIPGDVKYVPMIRKGISSIAYSLGFANGVVQDIELSVAEAIANAVQHGSPEQMGNKIVITCRFGANSLTVDVRDEGPGFEPSVEEGDGSSLAEGGRGLRLIYRLMDSVEVGRKSKGSYIRMVKQKKSSHAHNTGQTTRPR